MRIIYRKAFTLIELLVVIAILAILAAILFPVFAQAKAAAKKIACLAQMKQIGLATMEYLNDYDSIYPVNNWTYGTSWQGCQIGWKQELEPYMRNTQLFVCSTSPQTLNGSFVTIPGPGGSAEGSITVPWGQIGANEWIVSSVTPTVPTISWKGNVNESQIGQPASMVIIGDSDEGTFQDAPMVFNASFNANSWWATDVTPNSSESRHVGGSNLIYGDGHAKWVNQNSMAWNPSLIDYDGTQCPATPALFLTLGYCWNIPLNPEDPRLQ